MRVLRGPDNANTRRQERAFQHPDVVAIADHVVAGDDVVLIHLANMAIAYPYPGAASFVKVPPSLRVHADAIADAGYRIASEADIEDRKRRRGAVVERIVWQLVRMRDSGVLREHSLELTRHRWSGQTWSNPKELVAIRADACEAYECKLSPKGFDQDDLDEFADIRDTATAEGLTPYATLATLESERALRNGLIGRRTHGLLHFVVDTGVLALRHGEPIETISR